MAATDQAGSDIGRRRTNLRGNKGGSRKFEGSACRTSFKSCRRPTAIATSSGSWKDDHQFRRRRAKHSDCGWFGERPWIVESLQSIRMKVSAMDAHRKRRNLRKGKAAIPRADPKAAEPLARFCRISF